jgi:hypothetical protein
MTTIRPEVTGHNVGNVLPSTNQNECFAFRIHEFCARNGMSVSKYHSLKRAGRGPVEMRVGNFVRISLEEELIWRRALGHPKGKEAREKARAEAAAVARGRNAGKLAAQSPRLVSKMSPEERAERRALKIPKQRSA